MTLKAAASATASMMITPLKAAASATASMMITPAVFISHGAGPAMFFKPEAGSPLASVGQGSEAERLFRKIGENPAHFGLPPKPSAIVIISAHWETSDGVTVLMNDNSSLLYDYYGFPASTYEIEYGAPGPTRAFADRVAELINANAEAPRAKVDASGKRGWDHGVFIPLKLMYPKADVPIVQLSLQSDLDPRKHFELGRALRPLRHENVLIIGSGQATHAMTMQSTPEACKAFMTRLDEALINTENSLRKDAVLAATNPTDRLTKTNHNPRTEHLTPLLVCAGSAEADETVRPLFDKEMRFLGTFSLASYLFGERFGGAGAGQTGVREAL
jgi:aromatic ring-opening dioxygenase catalytic subunit (LigB family)